MKILCFGDIFGKPGRNALRALLPKLRDRFGADLCIANCENASGGAGVTPDNVKELLDAGLSALTSGDHIWDQKTILEFLNTESRLIRPLNYPSGAPGRGSTLLRIGDRFQVGLMQALGRTFMKPIDCPFRALDPEAAGMPAPDAPARQLGRHRRRPAVRRDVRVPHR